MAKAGKRKVMIKEVADTNYKVFISYVASKMKSEDISKALIHCYDVYYEDKIKEDDEMEKNAEEDMEINEMTPMDYVNPRRHC